MPTVAALLCLCALTLWGTADGTVFTPDLTSKIEEFVQNLIQCRGVVGLSLAVVKGNETWTRGFGMADRASGRPVNSSTLFGIGSVTKAFTTVLLGILIEDSKGKYTWKTPLKDVLGKDFDLPERYLTSQMTLKDILLHRTGLYASNIPQYAGFPDTMTRSDFTSRLKHMPVSAPFRDGWNYNNWMYTFAGNVAEVMGGASWEELLETRIFNPLQMTDSGVLGYDTGPYDDNVALPYVQDRNDLVLSDPSIYRIWPEEPAGAIAASADDMAKWISFHLQGGVTSQGQAVLNKTTLEEIYSPQIIVSPNFLTPKVKKPVFPVTFNSIGYGYAWFTAYYRGYKVTWHSGGIYSYVTYLTLIRDLNIGIYISTNGPGNSSSSATYNLVFYYIADLLLGEEPWLDSATACTYPKPWKEPTSQAPSNDSAVVPGEIENPQNFEGEYGHKLFGNVAITRNGSKEVAVSYRRMTGRLHKTRQANILMLEMFGPLGFMTMPGNTTIYINMTFTKPDWRGRYQDLTVTAPDMGDADVLTYQRGVRY